MKRFAMAVALTSVLSVSALAGEVPSGGFAPPPPPPPAEPASTTLLGEIPSTDFAQQTITDEVIVNVLAILSAGYLSIY